MAPGLDQDKQNILPYLKKELLHGRACWQTGIQENDKGLGNIYPSLALGRECEGHRAFQALQQFNIPVAEINTLILLSQLSLHVNFISLIFFACSSSYPLRREHFGHINMSIPSTMRVLFCMVNQYFGILKCCLWIQLI